MFPDSGRLFVCHCTCRFRVEGKKSWISTQRPAVLLRVSGFSPELQPKQTSALYPLHPPLNAGPEQYEVLYGTSLLALL